LLLYYNSGSVRVALGLAWAISHFHLFLKLTQIYIIAGQTREVLYCTFTFRIFGAQAEAGEGRSPSRVSHSYVAFVLR
jgi:hypothetical protein